MSWTDCTLGDVITLKRGHDLPARRRIDGDVPIVSSSGITGFHNEFKADAPGVVTGRYGTLGEVYFVQQAYWPLNTALYVLDFKGNNPRFIAYFLKDVVRNYKSDKAAVPGVDRNVLHRLKVRLPDRTSQERIADILSAYDDLIENNRRRIALLEQAARELYREWFVRLRFPGHEHTKFVDGVPEGWERRTAIEVANVMSGGTPKTADSSYWGGDIPFFTPKDATAHVYAYETEKALTEDGLRNCNSKLYPKNTVFLTARGTVGKINLAQTAMAMNQSCYALVAKEGLGQVFLYFALVEGVAQLKSRAVGAVFNAIIVDTFKRIPFVEPSETLVAAFSKFATPVVEQIDGLATQNRSLVRARDLLLPRLMSGEVAV